MLHPNQISQDSKPCNDGSRPHRFIFVGGSARSGTTLVQKMLCAHSRVCGGPEFDHANAAMKLFARMTSPTQLQRQEFYYSESELTNRFREFYASLFDSLASRNPGVAFISEKTPANIAAATDLLKLFPEAFYVNVIRDGRDVVLSHQKVLQRFKQEHGQKGKKWWHEYSVRQVSRNWNSDINRFVSMRNDMSIKRRVMNVKYEDLVSDPQAILTPIMHKLQLQLEPQQLHPETIPKDQIGYSVNVDGVWYTDGMFHQNLNELSVSGWKNDLPWIKSLLANLMLCRNLKQMGYDVPKNILMIRNFADRIRGRKIAS